MPDGNSSSLAQGDKQTVLVDLLPCSTYPLQSVPNTPGAKDNSVVLTGQGMATQYPNKDRAGGQLLHKEWRAEGVPVVWGKGLVASALIGVTAGLDGESS